jgi:hypothetical protein
MNENIAVASVVVRLKGALALVDPSNSSEGETEFTALVRNVRVELLMMEAQLRAGQGDLSNRLRTMLTALLGTTKTLLQVRSVLILAPSLPIGSELKERLIDAWLQLVVLKARLAEVDQSEFADVVTTAETLLKSQLTTASVTV